LAHGWRGVNTGVQRGLPPVEGMLSNWNTNVLKNVQATAQLQAAISAADLVAEVARANEPRAEVSEATRLLQVRNGNAWTNRFTTRYQRGGGDLRRFTRLLMDSRDGFTRNRRNDLPVSLPLLSVPRRGGTDLLGEYSWRGVDTVAAHLNVLLGNVELPLGWGAAEQRSNAVRQRGEHGGSLRTNPISSRRALRDVAVSRNYRGVPEIRDVVRPQTRDKRTLIYSVALRLPDRQISTSDRLLNVSSMQPQLPGNALHALGSAELYFQRPAGRRDGREEYPSLFSPYWQARLTATPASDRIATAEARGLATDPFAVLP
jgi:hypothetical protein